MIGKPFIKRQVSKAVDGILGRVENSLSWFLKVTEKYDLRKRGDNLESAQDVDMGEEEAQANIDRSLEQRRRNMQKNFLKVDQQDNLDQLEKSRQTSMLNSQGEDDHSGSSYHGPGKPMSGKSNSNMWQRNFDNHQGN